MLITSFLEGNFALCKVCFCVVPKKIAADHFSSELHIVRYLVSVRARYRSHDDP